MGSARIWAFAAIGMIIAFVFSQLALREQQKTIGLQLCTITELRAQLATQRDMPPLAAPCQCSQHACNCGPKLDAISERLSHLDSIVEEFGPRLIDSVDELLAASKQPTIVAAPVPKFDPPSVKPSKPVPVAHPKSSHVQNCPCNQFPRR